VFYQGDTKSDIGIRLGDVIEVPPASLIRVTVMGEVPRPGQYELKGEERLKDALMMAGFVGVNSALSEVAYLKRCQGEEKFENYKLNLYSLFEKKDESANIPLTDGDIISVPAIKTFVYVYGEVGKSGRYDYVPGMRLSDYINTAGGPSAASNLSAVTVTRQENNLPKVYHIDASQIIREGKTKHDIEILAGDVVSVPRNFFYFSDFPSFANTILIALTLYNTARIR
jgi:protein involved in polysaccharide export with SLBB domain